MGEGVCPGGRGNQFDQDVPRVFCFQRCPAPRHVVEHGGKAVGRDNLEPFHGIACLRVETDYGMEDAGQLKTRVEAFVETLA